MRAPKRRKASTAGHRSISAALENEIARLTGDLNEARDLQAATAEVLRVISTSPKEVQPVFDIIAESAVRLCQGEFSFVLRFENDLLHFSACHGLTSEGLEDFRRTLPRPAGEDTASGRSILHRAIAQIPDVPADPTYTYRGLAQSVTYRSILAVPMLRDGRPIGTIAVARSRRPIFHRPDSWLRPPPTKNGQIEGLPREAEQHDAELTNRWSSSKRHRRCRVIVTSPIEWPVPK